MWIALLRFDSMRCRMLCERPRNERKEGNGVLDFGSSAQWQCSAGVTCLCERERKRGDGGRGDRTVPSGSLGSHPPPAHIPHRPLVSGGSCSGGERGVWEREGGGRGEGKRGKNEESNNLPTPLCCRSIYSKPENPPSYPKQCRQGRPTFHFFSLLHVSSDCSYYLLNCVHCSMS